MFLCLFRPDPESDSEAEDVEHAEKLRQVKAVLEEVIYFVTMFGNLNRLILQIPLKF